ncbi:MAG: hypothetical protein HZA19_00735, partial [Nitrospirae bacterium]|nr:hypothetical protein [Nitrospirota bacterium]
AGVLSLHTKVMVTATLIIIPMGTLLILLTEWAGTLQGLPWWDAVLTAMFHSIVARTAGFNTIDVSLISSGTIIILALLMFIGGGPGSTAGGVKMSTVAILFSSARTLFRGRETPELFHRSIPKGVMMKAMAILSIAVMGLLLGTFLLSLTENAPLPQIFFESVSALGTVGLSMGLTPNLSPLGIIIVILMMFIGRIGPLRLVLAIGQRRKKGLYYYPEERVIMG